jgi:hypothetical protein
MDTLSLLALKCAPHIFDLSSGLSHVSIRDQVVRARILMRDVSKAYGPKTRVLVVGAGVGGVSAAMAAAELGSQVVVVDTNDQPFALQLGVSTRYVGPFMYEWPCAFSADQSYPPSDVTLWPPVAVSSPSWASATPMPASSLASQLTTWLTGALSAWATKGPKPVFIFRVKPTLAKRFVNAFRSNKRTYPTASGVAWPSGTNASTKGFRPDVIVLAAGMGPEDLSLPGLASASLPFWQNDKLMDLATAKKHVAIFGAGDGALQDTLRTLTTFPHPVGFLAHLRHGLKERKLVDAQLLALQTIEQQHRLLSTWTLGNEVTEQVDDRCREIAVALAAHPTIRKRVSLAVRRGTGAVSLVMRSTYFTKAYLLNRFSMHLIDACQTISGGFPKRMKLTIHRGKDVISATSTGTLTTVRMVDRTTSTVATLIADEVVVRFGIDKTAIPGMQLVGLSNAKKARRTSLAQIPLPFVLGDS